MSRRRAYAGGEALAVQPRPGRSCLARAWTRRDEGGREWEEPRAGGAVWAAGERSSPWGGEVKGFRVDALWGLGSEPLSSWRLKHRSQHERGLHNDARTLWG